MLPSEFSVNFHFLFTFFIEFSLSKVKTQFGHFLENDTIEMKNDLIEIGFFFD